MATSRVGADYRPAFAAALRRMQWTDSSEATWLGEWHPSHGDCWLASLWNRQRVGPRLLTRQGERGLRSLLDQGISCRAQWPRGWSPSIERWLGPRFYLSHASNFAPQVQYASLVSSSLGRHGSRLPEWPKLMDLALQRAARCGQHVLLAAGTTTYAAASQYARLADLPSLEVEWSPGESLESWFAGRLAAPLPAAAANRLTSHLQVSPAASSPEVGRPPQQDRLAIGLADQIYALAIRQGGNVANLLQQRIEDSRFPAASLWLALPERYQDRRSQAKSRWWLERGAVGWYVPSSDSPASTEFLPCRRSASKPAQQWTAPARMSPRIEAGAAEGGWLVHCTRGNAGPQPHESLLSYRQRLWLAGERPAAHPLRTLYQICQQGILRAAAEMTRTERDCVSFSARPLCELLKLRTYRAHLGRWDWEPYGLLIRAKELQQLGARAVIYAEESAYAGLPMSDRPFFQPLSRAAAGTAHDWSQECEWRLPGDLHLSQLPPEAIAIFVKSHSEAEQLSRVCAWPVFWVGGGRSGG